MPDDVKFKASFDSSSKPAAPPKKSLFERQKAEAEAKRARDRAETAAVYEDFVKSFEDAGDAPSSRASGGRLGGYGHGSSGSGLPVGGGGGGGPPKRHFTGSSIRAAGLGGLAPPPISRKRAHDGTRASHRDGDTRGIFGFEGPSASSRDPGAAFRASDDEEERSADKKEEERAVAKPTLHLSSLPPGTSPAVVKSLIPPVLSVDNVRIMPPSNQSSGERRIWSAIVTLSKETAATDMDTVVSSLQNRYLGWGYYLSISRHLSSAAIHSAVGMTPGASSTTSQPFGARSAPRGPAGSLNRAPPPRGFAPPSSYDSGYGGHHGSAFQVDVKPPADLRQLKLIHKTLENLLTYGPEFEALLMSRPEVQKEEKWAWIWNSRSPGGVWYRWKLWDVLTRSGKRGRRNTSRQPPVYMFDHGPRWIAPEKDLQFEYVTKLDEFVSDEDYDSSEEDDNSDREDDRRVNESTNENNKDGIGHLNPLQRAKLAHLLARLPTTNAKLRRGDVARVTAFAIKHAGEGADEVVEMIVSNVESPFAFASANPDWSSREADARPDKANDVQNDDTGDNVSKQSQKDKLDTSAAKLVGLYVISDILSSSSTSGVRHAWRYRQLFENAFKAHKTFEHLGRLEKELGWGRLKVEKWRRSIGVLLGLWEGWCVFPHQAHEQFVQSFEKPPLTEKEMEEERQRVEAEKGSAAFGSKGKSKWRTVDETASANTASENMDDAQPGNAMDMEAAGAPDEDLDGEPMSDIDGVPMEDSDMEDVDGKPLPDDSADENQSQPDPSAASQPLTEPVPESASKEPEHPRRRRRPKAEDMFADSDSDA